uniref:Uncharacterized protein n=1 Tax=Bos indicus x Bos taurus TaxID=30522 RepID=A0A4W2GVH4_BOBOX
MEIKFMEEIYLFSLPIKESEIIVFFLGTSLKDEVRAATALLVIGAIILAKLSIVPGDNGLLGKQDQQAPHCPLQGDWLLWLSAGVPHPCPQGHWHRLGPCGQDAPDDGWH